LRHISTLALQWSGIINQKSKSNEFFTSITCHSISTPFGYRQRMWVFSNCATADVLRMGSRGNCGFGYFEQSELIIFLTTSPSIAELKWSLNQCMVYH